MSRQLLALCLLLLASCCVSAATIARAQTSYFESFDDTLLRDAAATTADWNTVGGVLQLHYFVPQLVGSVATADRAASVALAGDIAYVADLTAVTVVEVSDPSSPAILATYVPPSAAIDVVVSGDLLFVAGALNGLQIADISDPANPVHLGTYNSPGRVESLDVAGDLAYVADRAGGLKIVDVSNPAAPVQVGASTTTSTSWTRRVEARGDLVYVADINAGLVIYDVTNPAAPDSLGAFPATGWDVAVDGNTAYVAGGPDGLWVVDVSDPSSPALFAQYDTPGTAAAVAVSGNRVLVGDQTGGLFIVDVSFPTIPAPVGTYDTPVSAYGLATAGDLAFVADWSGGLMLIRISYPTPLVPRATLGSAAPTSSVEVANDHAFVGRGGSLGVYQVLNLDFATEVNSYPGYFYNVDVEGPLLYAADLLGSIVVLDVQDPATSLNLVGTLPVPAGFGAPLELTVAGDVMYYSHEFFGIRSVDVSDPSNPVQLGTWVRAPAPSSLEVHGDVLFAGSPSELQLLDVSDPALPAALSITATPGAEDLEVRGDVVYVTGGTNYVLRAYDISDPTAPVLLGSLPSPAGTNAMSILVEGDLAFVADKNGQVLGVDISDPANPVIVATCELADQPALGVAGRRMHLHGQDLYVAVGNSGIEVIQVFQDRNDASLNIGQSLDVHPGTDDVLRARLSTAQTAGVTWELSADDGANWQPVEPGSGWMEVANPGSELLWRSTHSWYGTNPTVQSLTLDWRTEAAPIATLQDVPDDQGGQLRMTLTRSGYDFADETTLPVTGYQIYQRVDAGVLAELEESNPTYGVPRAAQPGYGLQSFNEDAVRTVGDRTFVIGEAVELSMGAFPAGTWEAVGWVAATQNDAYTARVSTVADSTESGIQWSVYMVTTHTTTPSVWFASAPDSSYSIDNIAPGVPLNLTAGYATDGVTLDWSDSPEEDFQYYRVYRDTDPGFVPSHATLLVEIATSSFEDVMASPWVYSYKVTALDHAGNESEAAEVVTVTGVDGPSSPRRYSLEPASPNPFNPRTTIAFSLPAEGHVRLAVYDVAGRRVATLVDGPQSGGRHEVQWNGLDAHGRQVASGVYLYRLEAPGFVESRRMVLVK